MMIPKSTTFESCGYCWHIIISQFGMRRGVLYSPTANVVLGPFTYIFYHTKLNTDDATSKKHDRRRNLFSRIHERGPLLSHLLQSSCCWVFIRSRDLLMRKARPLLFALLIIYLLHLNRTIISGLLLLLWLETNKPER